MNNIILKHYCIIMNNYYNFFINFFTLLLFFNIFQISWINQEKCQKGTVTEFMSFFVKLASILTNILTVMATGPGKFWKAVKLIKRKKNEMYGRE